MTSILDKIYARHANRLLFFKDEWGDLPRLRKMLRKGDDPGAPWPIDVVWTETRKTKDAVFRQGEFLSPYRDMPLPRESEKAFFELVMPRNASTATPVCIHLAATGDEGFSRPPKASGVVSCRGKKRRIRAAAVGGPAFPLTPVRTCHILSLWKC